MRVMNEAADVVRDLFRHYTRHPSDLPEEWASDLKAGDEAKIARRAGDFIAGMTDRFALAEHARFFDSTPELR
jgi:dGTPase